MRIIGIDPSLTCTAACVETAGTQTFVCFTGAKEGKWHKALGTGLRTVPWTYHKGGTKYADTEVQKLHDYKAMAETVVSELSVGPTDRVLLEGYAFRASGNLVDLVTFGTFLRDAIVRSGATLTVVAPMSLKHGLAKAVYPADKKGVHRNAAGTAGGKFTKTDMLLAIMEATATSASVSPLRTSLLPMRDELMGLKNVPSPVNDCADACALASLGAAGLL